MKHGVSERAFSRLPFAHPVRTDRRRTESPAPRGTTGRRDPAGRRQREPRATAIPRACGFPAVGASLPERAAAPQAPGPEPGRSLRAPDAMRAQDLELASRRPGFKPPFSRARNLGPRAAAPHPTQDSPTARGAARRTAGERARARAGADRQAGRGGASSNHVTRTPPCSESG